MQDKVQSEGADGAAKKNLKARALSEMKEYVLITLYLWLLFALFADYKRILLQENGINLWSQTYAIVNALILAKVVLLGEVLDLGKRLRKLPLIWLVLGKSVLFTVLLMVFHIAEETLRALVQHRPVLDSLQDFGGGTWTGFLVYAALLFVTLVPLFAFKEVQRVLGHDMMWKLMFSRDGGAARRDA
jgi:hypothetical protein